MHPKVYVLSQKPNQTIQFCMIAFYILTGVCLKNVTNRVLYYFYKQFQIFVGGFSPYSNMKYAKRLMPLQNFIYP